MGSAEQDTPSLGGSSSVPREDLELSPPAQAPLGHWEGSCWGSPPQRGWAGPDPTPPPAPGKGNRHHHPFGNLYFQRAAGSAQQTPVLVLQVLQHG